MLKRVAVLLALSATTLCSMASAPSAQNEFHFGGQVGLTESRITDLSSLVYEFQIEVANPFRGNTVRVTGGETSFNPGIAFGGWGYYVVNPNFGLQLGVFFSQQGGTLMQMGSQLVVDASIRDSTVVEYEVEHDVELRYMRFPLVAKVQYPTKYATPFVKFGPDLGILTSADLETRGWYRMPRFSNQLISLDNSEDFTGRFRKLAIALHFAGGVDVPIGSAAVYAEVSYALGLNDISSSTQRGFNESVKNQVLTASLGFYF